MRRRPSFSRNAWRPALSYVEILLSLVILGGAMLTGMSLLGVYLRRELVEEQRRTADGLARGLLAELLGKPLFETAIAEGDFPAASRSSRFRSLADMLLNCPADAPCWISPQCRGPGDSEPHSYPIRAHVDPALCATAGCAPEVFEASVLSGKLRDYQCTITVRPVAGGTAPSACGSGSPDPTGDGVDASDLGCVLDCARSGVSPACDCRDPAVDFWPCAAPDGVVSGHEIVRVIQRLGGPGLDAGAVEFTVQVQRGGRVLAERTARRGIHATAL